MCEEIWFCYSCLNPLIKREATSSEVLDIFGEVVESENKSEKIATDIYCTSCYSHLIAHAVIPPHKPKINSIINKLYQEYDGQAEGHWEIPFFILLLHSNSIIPLELYIVHNNKHETIIIHPHESIKRIENFIKKHKNNEFIRKTILKIVKLYKSNFLESPIISYIETALNI